jgi:polyphosphate glucokinase
MKILVVDVGGSNLKVGLSSRKGDPLKIPSGPEMNAARMVAAVKKATLGWKYDVVTIGYPGPVMKGRPTADPANLARGWKGFDFGKAFGKPVRVVNDAAMQALGSYHGGRMLFLGLGTGLGSALVIEGVLAPMELAHLPYKKGMTYEDYVGERGLKRLGRKKWTEHVHAIVEILRDGLQCDYVVLGGGQTKRLKKLPKGVRVGDNVKAIQGGIRLWEGASRESRPQPRAPRAPKRPSRHLRPVALSSAPGVGEGEDAGIPSAS